MKNSSGEATYPTLRRSSQKAGARNRKKFWTSYRRRRQKSMSYEEKEALSKRLARTAKELQVKLGHPASVSEVCRRAGIPRSSLYKKFPELIEVINPRAGKSISQLRAT